MIMPFSLRHGWRVVARLLVLAAFSIGAKTAVADFHTYKIEQVFTNGDGTVQFLVMHESLNQNGQQFWQGHTLTSSQGALTSTFVFPRNLPSDQTAQARVLIATQGFAALGVITPDYVVPNGFFPIVSGSINFADVDDFGYASIPVDGVHSIDRTRTPIQNVATNFAKQTASISLGTVAASNYEGLWWNSPAGSESGWGINFAHQGDVIFATWFTYDAAGKAWWLTMTASKAADSTFSGTLYKTAGPAFNAVPFNPAAVTATAVGSATLSFTDANNGTFAYTVNGVQQTKSITRQVFGMLPTCTFGSQPDLTLATNYQDLWWAAPAGIESGWGVNFTQQGDIIFATWFTYDLDGSPLWLSVTANKSSAGVFSGTLYRTVGPAFNAMPFSPAAVVATPVGVATLTFANGNVGTFTYTVNGISQSKAITRQVFRAPGTVCQ